MLEEFWDIKLVTQLHQFLSQGLKDLLIGNHFSNITKDGRTSLVSNLNTSRLGVIHSLLDHGQ